MKNSGYVYRNRVTAADDGICVVEYYSRHYPRFSRKTWIERIRSGQVFRDGRVLKEDDRLHTGDRLSYCRPPWVEPDVPAEFAILFEDDYLLVVNKPSGLPVLPGDTYLENTLLAMVRKEISPELSPIHRLDRPTSGVIIFAKTHEARRCLSMAIQNGEMRKTYLAVARGSEMSDSFVVSAAIGQVTHPVSGSVAAQLKRGRPSETRFRVAKRCGDQSLLMAFLKTGRSHQIRIHLAVEGCPLLGENFYGPGGMPRPGAVQPGEGDFLLHAWRLRFSHPVTGQRLMVTAPSPFGQCE
ncbi:MAG: RNA pseudouridine synthase [Acidobacteria bacterium CG_4_9_14_3_um_filter_49_7]|nr:MAG: RNA pseudouridine synthase [Acidobacteria bacterium CG_4_9_14_3_um_filter_49_7]